MIPKRNAYYGSMLPWVALNLTPSETEQKAHVIIKQSVQIDVFRFNE